MTKKLKGHANPLAELHFVANMPLEQAVMLIRDLADATYAVTLTEVDDNNFKFEIDDMRTHSRASKINGTLQRWQGTETRVDVTGDVVRRALSEKTLLFFVTMLVFLVTGFFILASGMMSKEHGFVYGFPALVIMIISAALLRSSHESLEEDAALPVQFRERDHLLQLIIDTFKSAGTVEAYEPSTHSENTAYSSETEAAKHKAKNS